MFEDLAAEGPMDTGEFVPRANHEAALVALGEQVLASGGALQTLREVTDAVSRSDDSSRLMTYRRNH